jgi:hypothetical protein
VVSIMLWPGFTPGEETAHTHWTGGWAGPRVSLDAGARGNTFACIGDQNLVIQYVVILYLLLCLSC